jgi:cell division protein FtsN
MRLTSSPGPGGSRRAQRGGFFLGLIVGLLAGLAVSLGVALYVTKVPVPFINKVPQRSPEQDAAQAEKNRNWDPNGPLAGKGATRPPAAAASAASTAAPAGPPAAGLPRPGRPADAAAASKKDGKETATGAEKGAATADPFIYFVQAGAYARAEDAEQQRANLALRGLEAKITEREQAGRMVYRVRVGPYEHKDEAEAARGRLAAAGVDSAMVRVQR